jgi:hypothetical protein
MIKAKIATKFFNVSFQQKPYRLTPDKKEVLRHLLDNLLNQGIISAVSPDEDLPITSPKRTHSQRGPPYDKDTILSQFRFCCSRVELSPIGKRLNLYVPKQVLKAV